MDGRSVCNSRRAHSRVAAGSTQHRAYRLRRPHAVRPAFLRNPIYFLERQNQRQKISAFLGIDGSGECNVAVPPGFVDLL